VPADPANHRAVAARDTGPEESDPLQLTGPRFRTCSQTLRAAAESRHKR